nr:MAG TPA: YopX protein [Caudoviricetes sp.]
MIPRFRAWDSVEKKFVEYFFITDNSLVCNMEKPTSDRKLPIPIEKSELILMQSTGLIDELGKELFEGDIILWTYWDEFEDSGSAKIVFDKGMFKLLDIRTGKEVWDNLSDCIENCNVYIEGNIYENRDLLEDK